MYDNDYLFEDIRPYRDLEIPAAMQRIADSEHFPLLARYVYPGRQMDEVRDMVRGFKTVREFQLEVMRCVNEQVVARSTMGLTSCGVEQLTPGIPYLFVSNHRDIMLDSCLMQYLLYLAGHDTTEITFGANLMHPALVVDIGKANKMFRVERGGSMRDFYRSSRQLSEYIRYTICDNRQSVWIAQRNGRTKDGMDRTDQGIVKMFGMSGRKGQLEAIASLNLVPVAVSYEWESCDILKAVELYKTRRGPYKKQPGEDLNSILTGIMQPKGRVHVAFCKPVTAADLELSATLPAAEFHRAVATLLDSRILAAYQLTPNNYIAHDMLHRDSRFQTCYTEAERTAFERHLEALEGIQVENPSELRDILLGIYANPVDSK